MLGIGRKLTDEDKRDHQAAFLVIKLNP